MAEGDQNRISKHFWGWPAVGFASAILLGAGVSIMMGPHIYIADAFFFIGFSLLLSKFWAWEETKCDTTRKTALMLTSVTVLTIFLFAGSCYLSYYLNLPKNTQNESVKAIPPSNPSVATVTPDVRPQPTSTPNHVKPKHSLLKPPQETKTAPIIIGGDVKQGGNGDCQQNIIGGSNNTQNCSPVEFSMTVSQEIVAAKVLASIKDLTGKPSILFETPAINGYEAALRLRRMFKAAGIDAPVDHCVTCSPYPGAPELGGISFANVNPSNAAFANAVEAALSKSGAIKEPIKRDYVYPNGDTLYIYIRKP